MAMSAVFENDTLKLIFNNTTAPLIGDATGIVGSGTIGNLYVALHTADPTYAGNQSSSEATYTGYTRVATARTTAAWTVTTTGSVTSASPASNILFPACTGGSSTPTFFSVGTSSTGLGKILYSGSISPVVTITNGITPQLTTATSIIVS